MWFNVDNIMLFLCSTLLQDIGTSIHITVFFFVNIDL